MIVTSRSGDASTRGRVPLFKGGLYANVVIVDAMTLQRAVFSGPRLSDAKNSLGRGMSRNVAHQTAESFQSGQASHGGRNLGGVLTGRMW